MKYFVLLCGLFTTLIATAQTDTLPSGVYSWEKATVIKSATGERRNLLAGKTMDLAALNIHTSTLGAGVTNHPLVAYNDREELIIIKEGEVQVTINNTTKVVGPGSVVFITEGDLQSFRNISGSPVTYYVITFRINNKSSGDTSVASRAFVRDWKELEVKKTDKGESRPIFVTPTKMFSRFDIHATNLNAGMVSHLPHTHRSEELILMVKGNGEMQIGTVKHKAGAGDIILLNANVQHAFTNTGTSTSSYFAIQWAL